jgi:hypothetical protein
MGRKDFTAGSVTRRPSAPSQASHHRSPRRTPTTGASHRPGAGVPARGVRAQRSAAPRQPAPAASQLERGCPRPGAPGPPRPGPPVRRSRPRGGRPPRPGVASDIARPRPEQRCRCSGCSCPQRKSGRGPVRSRHRWRHRPDRRDSTPPSHTAGCCPRPATQAAGGADGGDQLRTSLRVAAPRPGRHLPLVLRPAARAGGSTNTSSVPPTTCAPSHSPEVGTQITRLADQWDHCGRRPSKSSSGSRPVGARGAAAATTSVTSTPVFPFTGTAAGTLRRVDPKRRIWNPQRLSFSTGRSMFRPSSSTISTR